MGDSTCFMQPFSYASGIPNQANEALGHSVSFGRFMIDSTACDKWPSVSHNRYVEEAERYAQPGSVAQKKAFFEAHYKKIAAQRAAALLEQANAAAAAKSESMSPPRPLTNVPDPPKYMACEQELREKLKRRNEINMTVGLERFNCSHLVQVADKVARKLREQEEDEVEAEEPWREEEPMLVDTSGYNSSSEMDNCERVHPITEYTVWGDNSAVEEFSNPKCETDSHIAENVVELECKGTTLMDSCERTVWENNSALAELATSVMEGDNRKVENVMALEHSGTIDMEKPLLKESRSCDEESSLPTRKKKQTVVSSSKSSSIYHRAPRAPTSPAKFTASCFPRRESNVVPVNLAHKVPISPAKPTASCFPRRESNVIPVNVAHKVPTSPAKPMVSCFPRKEGDATPLHKKLASASEDKRRSTPKSFQKSVSFTPMRELSRFTSTVMRKIESSRVSSSSCKTPKDCSTLLKTPTMVSKNEMNMQPSSTPCSEKRRAKTPGDSSTTGAKAFGPKWRSIRTDCSKFMSACRNKAQSPFSSTPFTLRTEERAASRKKKLEEKFNADEAQKMQEKSDLEIRKFRQSLCFKARPLPQFYKERKAAQRNDKIKVPVTVSQKVGKKHSPTGAISVPSSNESSIKSSGSICSDIQAKNKRTPACSLLLSRSLKSAHENTSPNIQSS